IKELKPLEKPLPHTGKYADATYNISWADYPSGGPITNQMLAGKLHFGTMGDYPLIVNGAKFQETKILRTILFTGTGYNLKGTGKRDRRSGRFQLLQARRPDGEIDLDAGRQRLLWHAGTSLAGQKERAHKHRSQKSDAARRRQQYGDQQGRRPLGLLPMVGDHGIPRRRPKDL